MPLSGDLREFGFRAMKSGEIMVYLISIAQKSCWFRTRTAGNGSLRNSGKKTIWSLRWQQEAMGWP